MRAAARRTAEWTRQLGAVVTGAKVLAAGGPGAENPGTAGRPATRAGPAAATGARTVRPPPAPPCTGTARGRRTPAAPTRALLAPRTPPVQTPPAPTRVRLLGPRARDTRARWRTRPLRRNRGPGAERAGAGASQRRATIPGPAPGGQPRPPRRRSAAVPRHGKTRGAARNGGPARRSRVGRTTAPPVARRSPAGRCGAPGRSGPQGRVAAAPSGASRPPRERLTRCTRRDSSRRGTRPRSGPPAPPGGPA